MGGSDRDTGNEAAPSTTASGRLMAFVERTYTTRPDTRASRDTPHGLSARCHHGYEKFLICINPKKNPPTSVCLVSLLRYEVHMNMCRLASLHL